MAGVTFKPDFTKMYISTSTTADTIKQYDLTALSTQGINAAYSNNITFLARDDASGLNQIKSKSQEKWGVITLSNPSSLDNGDFLAIGDNAQDATRLITTAAYDGMGTPAGYQRLNRSWKTQVTGTPGTVKLEIDINDPDLDLPNITGTDGKFYIVLDSNLDGLFSDETPTQMYDDGTNGDMASDDGIYTRANIDFATGERFTFAQIIPAAPG